MRFVPGKPYSFSEGKTMNADLVLQYFFSGLTYGSIYAIVAIGFNIVYNSTGIINFAQGEFVMLGGMMTYTFSKFMPLLPAVILAVLLTALIGSLLEYLFIRSLRKTNYLQLNVITALTGLLVASIVLHSYEKMTLGIILLTAVLIGCFIALINFLWFFNRSFYDMIQKIKKPDVLQMIIITIGLSIITREVALHIWGEQVKTVPYFTGNEVSSIQFLGAHFSPQVLWVLGITAFIVILLTLFFQFTLAGQAMRGCSANREGASLCGINPDTMINMSFVLSAAIGGLAGSVVAPLTQTHYAVGTELAIKGFTVAILGGLGNSFAAVIAGLLLGLAESYAIIIFPEAFKDVVTISILLLVLFIKPSGLFGSKEASKLKDF